MPVYRNPEFIPLSRKRRACSAAWEPLTAKRSRDRTNDAWGIIFIIPALRKALRQAIGLPGALQDPMERPMISFMISLVPPERAWTRESGKARQSPLFPFSPSFSIHPAAAAGRPAAPTGRRRRCGIPRRKPPPKGRALPLPCLGVRCAYVGQKPFEPAYHVGKIRVVGQPANDLSLQVFFG